LSENPHFSSKLWVRSRNQRSTQRCNFTHLPPHHPLSRRPLYFACGVGWRT